MVEKKNPPKDPIPFQEVPGGKLPLVLGTVVLVLGHALRTVRHEYR
jgi:hypothetical protein